MLPHWLDAKIRLSVGVIVARTLGRTSLSAMVLTITSPMLIFGSIWFLASGEFVWAGCLITFASTFDMIDGALARAKNETSRFGAFLDSTLDRYSEVFIFLGLLIHLHRSTPESNSIFLVYIAITGSFLTSYVRTRAESLGFDGETGILERSGRIILIIIGLFFNRIYFILWVMAILTHITAIQRLIYVWRQSRGEELKSI